LLSRADRSFQAAGIDVNLHQARRDGTPELIGIYADDIVRTFVQQIAGRMRT
jgi:hypothetical protein